MKEKGFGLSAFAVAIIIIAVLFSACSFNSVDSSEKTTNPDEIITTTEPTTGDKGNTFENDEKIEPVFNYAQCMVAPVDEYSIELLGTQKFTPGYLLFHEDDESEYELLLAKKMKATDYLAEFKSVVYGVTESNEIIEVSKKDGSFKTVYTARHGSINYISDVNCFYRYVYFNDGDYIIELDPVTNECTEKLKSDKGVYRIFAGGDVIKINDISFYCDTCLEEEDYFIWQDNEEENYYWHHPETDEDELIENMDNVYTYGWNIDAYQDLFIWKVEK